MFSETDKDYITEALINEVAALEKPRETLCSAFLGTSFPQQLPQAPPNALVMEAMRLCIVDGWDHTPMWMQLLLDTFQLRAQNARIARIWERSRLQPPPAANPLDATVLNNGTPFVNRHSLRTQLNFLITTAAAAKPILVVNGGEKCGKSYSTNYIEHFSTIKSSITLYRMALDPELGFDMGARQVASDLVSLMGRMVDTIPAQETNAKLHARQLALWVLREAVQAQSQHWFVLDNFSGERLRQDTRDFLVALSDLITTGVYPKQCRLILIGFDRALLTVEPGKIGEEIVSICTPDHVQAAITEILSRAPAAMSPATVSPFVLNNLPGDCTKMFEINQRLRALLYAVQELTDMLSLAPAIKFEDVLLRLLQGLPPGKQAMPELQSRIQQLKESLQEILEQNG